MAFFRGAALEWQGRAFALHPPRSTACSCAGPTQTLAELRPSCWLLPVLLRVPLHLPGLQVPPLAKIHFYSIGRVREFPRRQLEDGLTPVTKGKRWVLDNQPRVDTAPGGELTTAAPVGRQGLHKSFTSGCSHKIRIFICYLVCPKKVKVKTGRLSSLP